MAESSEKGYNYGKRPWWFWVLVYVIIGAIVYYAIYYFVFARQGYNYQYPSGGSTNQQQQPKSGY